MLSSYTALFTLFVFYVDARRASAHIADRGLQSLSVNCRIEENFRSPYITAFFDHPAPVSGCISNETTNKQQEIHVISLGDGWNHGDDDVTSVTLKIRPRKGAGTHDGPLIFILQSPSRVRWHLEVERISNSSRHHFLMSRDSRLYKRDLPLRFKVKKYDLPSSRELLERWVRRKYAAVTSFAEIDRAEIIEQTVGPDPTASEDCVITEKLSSKSVTARIPEPQQTEGCSAPQNVIPGKANMYMIELGAAADNRVEGEVMVNIQTKYTSEHGAVSKEMFIILKSAQPVQWTVATHGIRGSIAIITNGAVDTESISDQMEIRSVVERFTNTGAELIQWVSERYGSPVAYTNVEFANKFTLVVDGGDLVTYRARNRGNRFSAIQRIRNDIERAHTATCHNRGIEISLRKGALRELDVKREKLALLDPKCQARENATHFILSSNTGAFDTTCGTTIERKMKSVVFKQSIVYNVEDIDNFDDREASGSGMGPGEDTYSDDEDYQSARRQRITVDVKCVWPIDGPVHPYAGGETILNVDYNFRVYSSDDFVNPLNFPIKVKNHGELFVEAAISHPDSRIRQVIQSCWLSAGEEDRKHMLITNGCIADKQVEFIDAPSHARRFSFKYYRYFGDEDQTSKNLSCELRVCSTDGKFGRDLPRCVENQRYCLAENIQSAEASPGNSLNLFRKVKALGPLHLILNDPDPNQPDIEDTPIAEHSTPAGIRDEPPCEKIVVEGLDSGTVVGIAFAAFIIGVLLTGALWYIHTHTGPLAVRGNRPRSAETSGESTPSSTAPITVHQINHH